MKISRVAVPLILICLLIPSMLLQTAAVRVLQGPIDSFFLNLTHYSCQAVNELVPHVSLALAYDLYFPGCFISFILTRISASRPARLLWLPVCSPGAATAPGQLEGPSCCSATTGLLGWCSAPPAPELRACHSGD